MNSTEPFTGQSDGTSPTNPRGPSDKPCPTCDHFVDGCDWCLAGGGVQPMSKPVKEFGYGYTDWPDQSVVGPVPEWEARGRALTDHSVRVFARTAGIGARWAEIASPGPDALPDPAQEA